MAVPDGAVSDASCVPPAVRLTGPLVVDPLIPVALMRPIVEEVELIDTAPPVPDPVTLTPAGPSIVT